MFVASLFILATVLSAPMLTATPIIEVDEDVYSYAAPNNGAGPQWCHGSSTLARLGDTVFISGNETLPGVKPLHNVRWQLWVKRGNDAWRMVQADPTGRTREPSPIGVFSDGRLFLSVNPTLTPPDTYSGPAQPHVLEFVASDPAAPPRQLMPKWNESVTFTEHSYRTLTVDGPGKELLAINNIGYDRAHWSFLDRTGQWSASGKLEWPWGGDYPKPRAIRLAYPNVLLRNRQVHFLGVSDIEEPNPEFAKAKFELTGNKWDYEFRRLFYSWTPDITTQPFRPWIELASRDKTCGWIWACDLHLSDDGIAHLLWHERSIDTRLRAKFYPEAKLTSSLHYARMRDGKELSRITICEGGEGLPTNETPQFARFHITPKGRLFVLTCMAKAGEKVTENRLIEIDKDGRHSAPFTLPLKHAFGLSVFTATPRAGSVPSAFLDLHGVTSGSPMTLRYARVRVE